eukprot:CAMPEP_0197030480 /NCGR_PEP_ID=MMETSP1384-20130603/9708_1 /TAXON_ID=29189 /ORGANISM="Ammonia sp." /LENGTH=393 /DNA_ID=CAMNT_0042459841 /DNA_START=412 /DNA_END=1593 /DNA_ORIENTATION=-
MEDTEWSKFIDTHSNRNWFLSHHEFNKKYTWRIFVAIWFILEMPALFLTILGDSYVDLLSLVYGVQYFAPVLFLAFLLCKMPTYDDVFFIRDEMKLILTAFLAMALFYAPAILLLIWFHRAVFIMSIVEVYALIGPFCIVYPHLYFPLKAFHLPKTLCALQQYRQELALKRVDGVHAAADHAVDKEMGSSGKFTLQQVLASADGFHAFTRYLNKEFAIENILFLLEVYQFQHKMVEIFGKDMLHSDDQLSAKGFSAVCFPESVPKSTLIRNMNQKNVHQCVAALFKKYVVDDAYFTINIAYESRMQLYELFAYDANQSEVDVLAGGLKQSVSTDWNAMYHLFDTQSEEIYRLLSNSFSRFRQSTSYQRLLLVQSPSSSYVDLPAISRTSTINI